MEKHYNPPHDITETDRMNIQHQWGLRVLGFYIHPSIELPLDAANLKIADVGTGTGMFLRDVEKLLPASAQLHGFDISTDHFPDTGTYPSSLFFHQQDLTLPFEDEFVGSFDIVNVRIVQMGLRGSDWEKGVKNLAALLKPEGYIQWIEPDYSISQILCNKPGAPAAASLEVMALYNAWWKENMYPGALQLPKLFLQNGLGIATHEAFGTSRVQSETSYHTPMLFERAGKMVLDLQVKKGQMDAEQADYLLDRAVQETRNGDVYQHSQIWVVVGRKITDEYLIDDVDEVGTRE